MGTVNDVVNHPAHYQTKSGLEVIDILAAVTEDLSGIEAVDTGNALKYLCRWKKKNGVQDLEKAVWYIQHLIAVVNDKKKKQIEDVTAQLMNGGQV